MRPYLMLFVLATGCLGEDAKGVEDDLDVLDEKADSFAKPTDHGAIGFGTGAAQASAITDSEKYHAWTFELSGDASVQLLTNYAVLGQRRTDTVLYLYKHNGTSWGPYIARNDDYGSTTYSKINRDLGAGSYRVLVKGFAATTRGKFKLTVDCDGEGCAPPYVSTCLFGDTFYELRHETPAHLQLSQVFKVTPANLASLSPIDQQRLLRAVHESSHDDVTTPAEALSRVDQQEVNLIRIWDTQGRRNYLAFEYGAGDNSYGAIFDQTYDTRATSIHDGDLYNCEPMRQACVLPADWLQLRTSTQWTRTATRTVTSANQLSGLAAEQALAALRRAYDDSSLTLAAGIAQADGGSINLHTYRRNADGRSVDVVEFGAGDTSVGQLFLAGTNASAGVINDLTIEGCGLFE